MKTKIIIILTLFFTSSIFAQSEINSGMSFLKIGFGARNIALGDVGVISSNNVSAVAYNPALLTYGEKSEVALSHSSWMNDVSSEMLGAKFSLFSLPFALYINSSQISDIEIRRKPGEAVAKFNANYFAASLSSAYKITNSLSAGASVKFLYQGMYVYEATGWAVDFGAYYRNAVKNLDLSFAVRNIGTMNKLKEESTKLPSLFSFGMSYQIIHPVKFINLKIFAATKKYFDDTNLHLHFGTEFSFKDFIYLRTGYQTGYDARSYSVGLGLLWRGINFDYAFAPFDYSLGNSNIISVQFTF